MLYCFCSFSLDSFHKVASLCLTAGTLFMVILGYRKFLKNQLKNKQLDTVYELIKQIQQTDFHYIQFYNPKMSENKSVQIFTLFDIALNNKFENFDKLYFWGIDTEEQGELMSWDFFFKFHSHPFLPKKIAEALTKFNPWMSTSSNIPYNEVKDSKHIIIGRKKTRPHNAYCYHYTEGGMTSSTMFRKAAIDLKNSIIEWAEEYGVNDLNITTSHIHQSKQ